ncbi:hypothetical protein [Natrialba chahannaoensis]|uniref:hypothetical protein n=1 Tax=Natrialba chahannaoensis TaxID=68911 RepID=UPI000AFA0303|nr:hypothetical protein [Natrialba chahannaoensis]
MTKTEINIKLISDRDRVQQIRAGLLEETTGVSIAAIKDISALKEIHPISKAEAD